MYIIVLLEILIWVLVIWAVADVIIPLTIGWAFGWKPLLAFNWIFRKRKGDVVRDEKSGKEVRSNSSNQ